jgi:hypothetical protein
MVNNGWIDENGNLNPKFKNIEQGAATSVWAAVAPELENQGGLYLEDCVISTCLPTVQEIKENFFGYLPYALDLNKANQLWDLSEKIINSHK